MLPNLKTHIVIVGAGLSGTYLAILLAKRGYTITVYERRSRHDTLKTSDRSLNISFHNYCVNALKKAGVWEEVKKDLVELKGSITKLPYYPPIFASFTNLKLDYWSAKREKLLSALVKKAGTYPNIIFSFGTEIVSVDRNEKTLLIKNLKTNRMKTIHADVIVAADGVNSTVRSYIQRGQHTLHSQIRSSWEYKQIPLSADIAKQMLFHKDRAYSSTRKDAIFVALPNNDGTFSGMLAVSPKYSYLKLDTDVKIEKFITNVFPELTLGVPEILRALKKYPTGNFVTMTTFPWYYQDSLVMVGDAGHSVTPFIGHGVTIGFGDCLVLVSMIDKYDGDFSKAFKAYGEERKKNVDILVSMSIESFSNFQRERKADYHLIYGAFESLMHRLFPTVISAPIFEQVVHNPDTAYQAMKEHLKQRKLFNYMGVRFLVKIMTYLVLVYEKVMQVVVPYKPKNTSLAGANS